MLVYSSNFYLEPAAGLDAVFECIARWLGKKTNGYVSPKELRSGLSRRLRDGSSIDSFHNAVPAQTDGHPFLASVRFSHADDVRGRQWTTEIGIRKAGENHGIYCSFLLQTSEVSARVITPIQVTRPTLVKDLMDTCSPVESTPSLKRNTLDETNAPAFAESIEREDRVVPWVVVSPKRDGGYIVSPDRLRSLLVGVADCYEIPSTANTFEIQRLLGNKYAAWLGAVNIIYPARRSPTGPFCEYKKIFPEDLLHLIDEGADPASEILSNITHRTNLPNSWKHISPSIVSNSKFQYQLKTAIENAKAASDSEIFVGLLEEADRNLEERKATILDLQAQLEESNAELSKIESENRGIRHSLSGKNSKSNTDSPIETPTMLREAIDSALDGKIILEKSLFAISTLYPDRIVVLDTAYNSAESSREFKHTQKSFDLLWTLATRYWEILASGKGDAEAKQVFGAAFAAQESDSLTIAGRKRRIFHYNGVPIEMQKHLKIGVKDSVAETLRVHFEWLAKERKIVIGHCGRHLDF